MSSQHLGNAEVARRVEAARLAGEAASLASQQKTLLQQQAAAKTEEKKK